MTAAKHVFTLPERYGVWWAHGRVCYWCQEPLDFRDTTIDHVIPETLEADAKALDAVRKELSLPSDFEVNDFPNWVPAHDRCNRSKSTKVPIVTPATIRFMQDIAKSAAHAKAIHDKTVTKRDKEKLLAKVAAQLDANKATVDDVLAVLSDDFDGGDGPFIIGGWCIVKGGDGALVQGPPPPPPPIDEAPSWRCEHCLTFGVWKDDRCGVCGWADPFEKELAFGRRVTARARSATTVLPREDVMQECAALRSQQPALFLFGHAGVGKSHVAARLVADVKTMWIEATSLPNSERGLEDRLPTSLLRRLASVSGNLVIDGLEFATQQQLSVAFP